MFLVELADGPPKPRGRLILLGQDLGIEALLGLDLDGILRIAVEGLGLSMLSLSKMAEAQVPEDLVEPGKELALGVEGRPELVGPGKGLLGQLQGVFVVAHQTEGHKVGLPHVLLDKGLKRLLGVDGLRPLQGELVFTDPVHRFKTPYSTCRFLIRGPMASVHQDAGDEDFFMEYSRP